MNTQNAEKKIKLISTVLVLGAVVLQLIGLVAKLPVFLQVLATITGVILAIHAAEGLIAAVMILRYRLRPQDAIDTSESSLLMSHLPESLPLAVLKAGLYVFFVGTVGLVEIIREMTKTAGDSQAV